MCGNCYKSCPLRESGITNLEEVLQNRVFGQKPAIDIIKNALTYRSEDTAVVFHFAGDNGVGKTLTAKIIAESLFAVKDQITKEYKGMLYLRGNFYCSKGVDNGIKILEEIVDQLVLCQESVIIFDEAELPDRETMQIFETILDESPTIRYNGKEVVKSKAIFILISDFGMEGITNNMSTEEIVSLIHEDTSRAWEHTKQNHVITHIVPFLPMEILGFSTPDAITKQIQYLLQRIIYNPPSVLKKYGISVDLVEINNITLRLLSDYVYRTAVNDPQYMYKNYRGIEQFFNKNIVPQIARYVVKFANSNSYSAPLNLSIESIENGVITLYNLD